MSRVRVMSGVSGMVTITKNGVVKEVPETVKISAKAELTVKEWNELGQRRTNTKVKTWKGTGSMTMRMGCPIFREAVIEFIKTGILPDMSIYILNNDPVAPEIKTLLLGIVPSSVDLAALDIDQDILDQEVSFTFNDLEDM